MQLRRLWSNVRALNLNLWTHMLIEVWAWGRPAESLSDRSDRPWDDAGRRPSHADRRRAVQRVMLEEGISADQRAGAVVAESPPPAGRGGQAGRLMEDSSWKVQSQTARQNNRHELPNQI